MSAISRSFLATFKDELLAAWWRGCWGGKSANRDVNKQGYNWSHDYQTMISLRQRDSFVMFTCRSLIFYVQMVSWPEASLRWSRSRLCLWQCTDCELWLWTFTIGSSQYFVNSLKGCSISLCPPTTSFSRVHFQDSEHSMSASNWQPRPVMSSMRQCPDFIWRPSYPVSLEQVSSQVCRLLNHHIMLASWWS